MATASETVSVLRELVFQARREAEGLAHQLQEAQERVGHAEALLRSEEGRLGLLPKASALNGRFAGMGLRQAAVNVLREAGEGVTLAGDAIQETLRKAGFEIRSEYPGRALHAALIGVTDVERPGKGLYRWSPERREVASNGVNAPLWGAQPKEG